MPDFTPPDVDTSAVESAPVTPGDNGPAAPAYNQPSLGTKILGALSGGLHDTSYKVDPNTGQMAKVTDPNVRKPGDMFRSMLAGMLTGLAGGVQANANGSHGGLAAFAGGAQASMQQAQQMDQQKRAQAQQQFVNGQSAQTAADKHKEAQANFVKAQDDHTMNAFKMAADKTALQEHEADQANNLAKVISTTPGAKHVAFAKDFPSLVSQLKDPQERAQLMDWRAKGELVQHPVVDMVNGNPTVVGVDFSHIPAEFLDKPTSEAVSYTENKVDPKTGKSSFVTHEIPAGQLSNRDAISIQQKPMTGAITPEKQLTEDSENDRSNKTIEANKELHQSEFGQQRALQAQRSADEEKLARDKGEIISNDEDVNKLVDQFGNYHRDVKDFTRLDAKTGGKLSIALAQKYPGWNESTYQASQHALDAAAKGTGAYQSLQPNDQGIQHLAALHKLVNALPPTSNVQLINRTIQNVARQTGNTNISSLDALTNAVASEVANARAKTGHATEKEIELARKDIDPAKGTQALKSAIETVGTQVIPHSLESMAGELQRQVPGLADREYRPNISKGAEQALQYFKQPNPFNYGKTPAPQPGFVKGGYKFVGGDPSKKESWKPAQ